VDFRIRSGAQALEPDWRFGSALAGNGEVFATAGMAAIFAALRNRAGDFIGIDPAIGGGLGKIP
jgi:hypothetical protein